MASILLIEDMASVRSSLATVLQTAGHSVTEAEDGDVGLKEAKGRRFDLIITDIIMPNLDGSEVIMTLKQQNPGVPVLGISGGGNSVNAETALLLAREMASAVLAKPFSRQDLLDTVTRLTGEDGAKTRVA